MRLAIETDGDIDQAELEYAVQLGASGICAHLPALPGKHRWEALDLIGLRSRVEAMGLRLEAIENTPLSFYDRAMLNLDGRDEQIRNYQETIRNLGRSGIPVLGFHWMPNGVWRTTWHGRGRGGVLVSGFDETTARAVPPTHGRIYSEEEIWNNFESFVAEVLPVAEQAGVRLALHPDDPPVPSLGGIARVFRSFEAFERATSTFDTRAFGLNFCMGTWSEMGIDVIGALRHFGTRDRIVYVHFRDVQGSVPRFQECFLGEGNVDVVRAVGALSDVGFTGFMIDDHVPTIPGDAEDRQAHAHATGFIQGLLAATRSSDLR